MAKIDDQPTTRQPGTLDAGISGRPELRWSAFTEPDLWISFLMVVRPATMSMITGIYSWTTSWRFPFINRVPYYYHDPTPAPTLEPGETYEATYMAVDLDGWIPYIDSREFGAKA